ncbi:Carbohydrate-binding-like fold [Euphorbia peplus]|nr:Carbohydrate-binding-like fold [Euphorbia peplus]
MAALSSCISPKIFTRNSSITVEASSKKALLGQSEISFARFPTSKKLQNHHLIAKSHLVPDAVEVSTDFQNAAPYDYSTSKTIHVKFQLQKECMFGDEILLVGDHPILGLWNPANALPMSWSNGHIWNVYLDVPIETTMQFKFILKQSSGEVFWQPGQDRIFKSWESKAVLIVAEDWENPEAQKISEEQEETVTGDVLNQRDDMNIKANVDSNVMFSENTDYAKEKLMTFNTRDLLEDYRGQVLAPGLMPQQALSEEFGSAIVDSSYEVDGNME